MYRYLQKLARLEDFDVQLEYKTGIRGKWVKFSTTNSSQYDGKYIVHRKCLNKEIILDLDSPDLWLNKWALYWIQRTLDGHGISYHSYYSGGKGFHVSIFFDVSIQVDDIAKVKSVLTTSQRLSIIRRDILEKIKHENPIINNYYQPLIDWQMIDTHRKLIRAEGSRHHKGGVKFLLSGCPLDFDGIPSIPSMPSDYKMNKVKLGYVFQDILLQEYNKPKVEYTGEKRYVRRIVKQLLRRKIVDGRKMALYIIVRELRHSDYGESTIKTMINIWNNIGHEKGRLPMSYVQAQINNKNTYPLKSVTIKEYINNIIFTGE